MTVSRMAREITITVLVILCVAILTACAQTRHEEEGDLLTVGTVQKEIKKGMSGSQVVEALGSPNIVSTDEQGREVWVYDKISTDRVQSGSSGYGTLILFGYERSESSSSTSQKTLTIVIKFDNDKKVRDFAYHSSRF
jgi:outer membrane protein assembly factor BamE (lipoprotein component of BamABCDE complex)